MVPLTQIVQNAQAYQGSVDTDLINRAYEFSAKMHEGQFRKSGEPYFVHPASVADIITRIRLDSASICAGLLHDVVEDTKACEEDILREFGGEVAFLVQGVTKLGQVDFFSREDRQAESFRKMLVAMARDIRVLLVKLADRLDNMRSLDHVGVESQDRTARETMEIYAPLAARLGIQWMKDELEDLSFKYLHPEAHGHVSGKLREIARGTEAYCQQVVGELRELLAAGGVQAEVSGCTKHPYSVYRKMRENHCDFDHIHDLMTFRVVLTRVPDCYLALWLVHSRWIPVPGRFKDYIALPKTNMYQSLHTTVIGPSKRRMEVQIRTSEMHRTADMGIAAHWRYRESGATLEEEDVLKFGWLRSLVEYQKDVADPDEFLDGVKVDLFRDEVCAFTPKGDLRVFPRGATPVDFAYSIHSEIGEHCYQARVDGVSVPLSYRLHNGDTVEIVTSPRQHPSKEWLGFVATARARARIRAFLRSQERRRSINLGKELLERQTRRRDLSFARLMKTPALDQVVRTFDCSCKEDLLASVGYGRVGAAQVVEAICAEGDEAAAASLRLGIIEKTVNKVTARDTGEDIVIRNMGDMLVRFAKCCNPVPGDPITGWITRGRGVAVHRRGCPRALELAPERRIGVSWSKTPKSRHRVVLRVISADRPGILASLSKEFNDKGVNIDEAKSRGLGDGRARSTFRFEIVDISQLRTLMRSIAKMEGVYEVERVNTL